MSSSPSTHPFVTEGRHGRILGTIIGSALGDAIGVYTEFHTAAESRKMYPNGRFRLSAPITPNTSKQGFMGAARWTDDTDQAILILLSFLHSNGKFNYLDFAARLKVWSTQGLLCLGSLPFGIGALTETVTGDPRFDTKPELAARDFWIKSGFNAAPNGSLMRAGPIGVMCLNQSLEETFDIAARYCFVSHTDPRCVISSVIGDGLIRGLARGEICTESDMDGFIEASLQWYHGLGNDWWGPSPLTAEGSKPDLNVAEFGMNDAFDIPVSWYKRYADNWWGPAPSSIATSDQQHPDKPPLDLNLLAKYTKATTFKELELDGKGTMEGIGYIYKCLGSGLVALRLAMRRVEAINGSMLERNCIFEDLISDITMEGGDSDTNGAFAGALLGAYLGFNAMPSYWVNGMRHIKWLCSKAEALSQVLGITAGSYDGTKDRDTRPDGGKGFISEAEIDKRWKLFQAGSYPLA
jgi:ADP-ribosylglycohydrolase